MARALSYSRANTFDECPAKFKAEYLVERRGGTAEPYLVIGSFVHEALDRYVKFLKEIHASSDFDKLDDIADELWNSHHRGSLPMDARSEIRDLLIKAREMLVFEDIGKVHAAEVKLAVDKDWKPVDYESDRAWVRGKVDRIDIDEEDNVKIVDYKSGYRIVGVSDSWQIKLYARLMLAYMPAATTMDVELAYIRHRSLRSGRVGPEEMSGAQEWIEGIRLDMEKAAKADRYPARPGAACRGCAAFATCPARATTVKPVPPRDEAHAIAMVARLILIDRERKEIMEAITPFVDQYGDIDVNGMVLGYQLENRLEFDVARVASILENRGLRPLRYMKVDANEIRKLGRMDQKLAVELEKSAKPANQTKLKLIVSGEDQ
jgi:RecB family exonuclease